MQIPSIVIILYYTALFFFKVAREPAGSQYLVVYCLEEKGWV